MDQIKNYEDLMDVISDDNVQVVNLRFTDLFGFWQHISIPVGNLNEAYFKNERDGLHFDISQYDGWSVGESNTMLLKPVETTSFIDPFSKMKTLVMICNIYNPVETGYFEDDPRYVSTKAERYLKSSGVGDCAYYGPDAAFFIFDGIRYNQTSSESFYQVSASMASSINTVSEDLNGLEFSQSLSHSSSVKNTQLDDIRNDMMLVLKSVGVNVESQRYEIGGQGQAEIDVRYDGLVSISDDFMKYKYIIKQVAHKYHKTATFMPKPLISEKGSGMPLHFSLWDKGRNLFHGTKEFGLSQLALYAIGGILAHASALFAFTNPTTNSYKRLMDKNEPTILGFGQNRRDVMIRIPSHKTKNDSSRIIIQNPDPSCNSYLAFSAILMAALDGIYNKIDPGEDISKVVNHLKAPGSLEEALKHLEKDHDFLLEGNVFSETLIQSYIDHKFKGEIDALNRKPHPWEFNLYYDI